MKIDLNDYKDFVLKVTAEPSMRHSALVDRLEELQFSKNAKKSIKKFICWVSSKS